MANKISLLSLCAFCVGLSVGGICAEARNKGCIALMAGESQVYTTKFGIAEATMVGPCHPECTFTRSRQAASWPRGRWWCSTKPSLCTCERGAQCWERCSHLVRD